MIQVHDTDRALYLYFVAFSGCFTLTLGLGFVLLWEPNAAADLIGGGTQVEMWVMESGCKYRGSFTRLPATHLLWYGPVPTRPQTSTGVWPRGWGPLICRIIVLIRRGARGLILSAPPLHRHRPRKGHVRAQWESSLLQDRNQLSPERTLLASWSWTSSFHNCKKTNFCCLSQPVCGILLWQLKQTNIRTII